MAEMALTTALILKAILSNLKLKLKLKIRKKKNLKKIRIINIIMFNFFLFPTQKHVSRNYTSIAK